MIYFRDKKYGGTLNTSFFARNGEDVCDLSRFQIGDKVSIFCKLSLSQARAIMDHCPDADRIVSSWSDEPDIFLPFRVAERSHALAAQRGDLRLIGESIVLEAETGIWEDVFRWLCMGERPVWVEDEPQPTGKE